ncbi:MAG: GyrI-like domain-containing protein [Sphingobacteriaceae bacterium]|nr:GyrI-like domain-containing protein [Sphingobacteriaceae bacterium]
MVGDLAAVMEFANGTKISGLEKWETPAGKVLLIEYYGSYDKSGNAHYAMDAYMKEKGYTQGTVLEEYVTDPMSEKDTAKWLTNIFYIVK